MKKKNVLLLTLEFPNWYDAARAPYEHNFGLEEGFEVCGIEYTRFLFCFIVLTTPG